jgi:hypothetical protein
LTHPRKIPFSAASTGQLIAKLESYVEGDIRDLHIDLGEFDPENPTALQDLYNIQLLFRFETLHR